MSGRGLALLLIVAAGAAACGGGEPRDPQAVHYERLRAELRQRGEHDPTVSLLRAEPGEVLVGVRTAHLGNLIRAVVREYFDRVDLDLRPDLHIRHTAEISKRTLLGKITAGRWTVELELRSIRGALHADAPVLDVKALDRIGIQLPVTLQGASGRAWVRFTWDARGLANVACHDFALEETIEGRILPQSYRLAGGVAVSSDAGVLVARPDFPPTRLRLKIELSESSWAKLKARLEEQDVLSRCGLFLDPEEVVGKISAKLREGIDVKMPRSLFVPLHLPASIERDVTVRGRALRVTVEPRAFHVTRELTWYAAGVSASASEPQKGG